MIAEIVCSMLLLQESGQEKPIPPTTEKAASDEILGIPVHGSVAAKYRFRSSNDSSDHDLYEYVAADFGKSEGTLTGHLFLRATEDLDGHENGYSALNGITESYSSFNARFYYGHLDVHRWGPAELIRAGRQLTVETPLSFHFDGLRVDSKPLDKDLALQFGAYGGIPVHLYESSPSGDWIAGGYAQCRPWEAARFRLDYVHVRDDYLFGTQNDNLIGVGMWQSLDHLLLQAQYTMLDSQSRDVLARATYYRPEADLRVELSYYQLFKTQHVESVDLDYYAFAAQDYFPYIQGRLLAAKGFGEHFLIQGGIDWRELRDADDQGTYNHAFRRFYLTPTVTGLLLPGLSISLTGEVWEVPKTDNGDFVTFGLDVTHRCTPEIKISAGTAYALYKFDYFNNAEQEDVRTIYLKAVYAQKKGLRLDLGYDFEFDDVDTFHTLKFGAGWVF